jgi:hypothetical protein
MYAFDGKVADAVSRFDRAVALAEVADLYSAAWLTATCAPALLSHGDGAVRMTVERYRARMGELGSPEMTRRYELLGLA